MLTTFLAAHRPVGQMQVSAEGRLSDRGKPTIDIVGVVALSERSTEPNQGAALHEGTAGLMADSAAPTRRREGGTLAPVKTKDAWREPSPLHIGDVDMRRWTIRILVALFGLIVVAALTGATYQWLATRQDLAATPPPGQLIDIGGYRLHLWCTGNGAPVVVLDAGLGGTSAGWGFVQPEVARFTRVCSYDRAGMGYSDPGPSPRTARRIANELAELLARDGIAGPVVLAGESIAGFNVRLFASDHPERTAGLVLVDASHEDDTHEVPGMARFVPLLSTMGVLRLLGVSFGQRVESLAPSVRRYAQATSFRGAGYRAAADEIIHIRETVSEVRSSRRRLTIPVLVVTGARGADANWRRLQQDQASLSERGCLITAQQAGHVVTIDQPEVVVDAIRTVVETARGHDVPCAPRPQQAVKDTQLAACGSKTIRRRVRVAWAKRSSALVDGRTFPPSRRAM